MLDQSLFIMRIGNTYDSAMSISKQKWGNIIKVKIILFSYVCCSHNTSLLQNILCCRTEVLRPSMAFTYDFRKYFRQTKISQNLCCLSDSFTKSLIHNKHFKQLLLCCKLIANAVRKEVSRPQYIYFTEVARQLDRYLNTKNYMQLKLKGNFYPLFQHNKS